LKNKNDKLTEQAKTKRFSNMYKNEKKQRQNQPDSKLDCVKQGSLFWGWAKVLKWVALVATVVAMVQEKRSR
jgi:hypothetical protein